MFCTGSVKKIACLFFYKFSIFYINNEIDIYPPFEMGAEAKP